MDAKQIEAIRRWRPVVAALDPWRSIGVDEIDSLYVERGDAPHSALSKDILLASAPTTIKVLLCGARGSGKTTELARLAGALDGACVVVQADLNEGLPEQTSTLAIVTLLGAAALRVLTVFNTSDGAEASSTALVPVAEHTANFDRALGRFGSAMPKVASLLDKVGSVLRFVNAEAGRQLKEWGQDLGAMSEAAQAAQQLKAELAQGPLGSRVKDHQKEDAQAVVRAVNDILRDLERRAKRPVLLLADGLDRRKTFADVEKALENAELLRDLASAMILTGPIQLRHDPRFQGMPGDFKLKPLYNIPVVDAEGRPDAIGIALLTRLYQKRRMAADLPVDLFDPALIEKAARYSSGIVRDFLLLLEVAAKNAAGNDRKSVEMADLDAAIRSERMLREGYLNTQRIALLARTLRSPVLPNNPEADLLLFGNFFACYPNGDPWYRPHELIVDYVARYAPGEG